MPALEARILSRLTGRADSISLPNHMNLSRRRLAASLLCLAGGSCAQLGPTVTPPASFNYNGAMAQAWNEQLLLNLVRLRYQEPPFFLEASSVVTGYTFSGDVRSVANLGGDGGMDDTLGFNGGLAYSERPTITYQPLVGEAFTQKMLAPIAPETLILLARSGWSVRTILLGLVQEINGLTNPHSHLVFDPPGGHRREDHGRILRVATLLEELQETGDLTLEVAAESGAESRLIISGADSGPGAEMAREVRALLSLPPGSDEFRITRLRGRQTDEISIVGRSLLDALRYLSRGVQTPERHEREGLVVAGAGENFPEALFAVRARSLRPSDDFVKIRHGGSWFYIANDDLDSKAMMGLLTQLFSLQAASGSGASPLLTLPQ